MVCGPTARRCVGILCLMGIACQSHVLPSPVVLVQETNILGEALVFDDTYLYWTAASRQPGPQVYYIMRQPRSGGQPEVVAEVPDLVDGALVVAEPVIYWGTQAGGAKSCGCLVRFDGSNPRCLDIDLGCSPTPIALVRDGLAAQGAPDALSRRF